MTYTFTTDYGNDVILAPCLQVLCAEIAERFPDAVNLGEIGDGAHKTEAYKSDHNPFIVHDGKHYVRAIDVGGSDEIQTVLFNFINERYKARDPRLYPYGYTHKDNYVTVWFGNGNVKYDAGDVGHVHISVTQKDGNSPSPDGWVSALDSRDPWGLVPDDGGLDNMDAQDIKALADQNATSLVTRGLGGAGYNGNLAQLLVDYHQQQVATNNKLDQIIALLSKG